MSITVTIAPCRAHAVGDSRARVPMWLMEIAQNMADDCDGDVPIHVLDGFGHEAAVIGGHDDHDGNIELF